MDRPPPTKKTKLAKTETEELDGLNKSYEQHSVSSTATTPSLSEINKRVSFASGTNSSESVTVPTKEPRLVMKKMVLNNFKSYAGRQVIGPFHKCQ
ncbi:hypothetical protein G6F23_011899 [Rhizopus arrhizus]|nr:hypothetical protein G6F23_011899 [Rhizopus arrhizus]